MTYPSTIPSRTITITAPYIVSLIRTHDIIIELVTEVHCTMKKFLIKVWWGSTATRVAFPIVCFGIGISIFMVFEDNNILSKVGMAFIVIALITFAIGFSYGIHSSARDVDRAMDEREEREKREGKHK
jgi:predicted acyltransferase